jgi:hypothetical protein
MALRSSDSDSVAMAMTLAACREFTLHHTTLLYITLHYGSEMPPSAFVRCTRHGEVV